MYIDFLTKIKNAEKVRKETLKVRFTNTDKAIAEILEAAGFIKKAEVKGKSAKKMIEIELNGKRPIGALKFLSKPSIRRYVGYKKLSVLKRSRSMIVLSTSKGIMTAAEAKKHKIGGQLLFEVW